MQTKKKSTRKGQISKSHQIDLIDRQEEMLRFTKFAIEHSGDMAFWMNSKGQFIFVNDTACNVYGYTREELLNMTIFDIGHDISRRNWKNTWQKIKQSKNYSFETVHYKKNGIAVPVEVTINFLEYKGEEYNCAFARDISERLQIQQALEEQSRSVNILQKIAVAANESSDVNIALQICLDEVCKFADWPIGHVYMTDTKNPERLLPTKIWFLKHPRKHKEFRKMTESTTFNSGDSLPGQVLATGKPIWLNEFTKHALSKVPRARLAKKTGIKAAFAFPVFIGKYTAAVLEFFSFEAKEPDDNFLGLMNAIGTQLGRAIERHHAELNLKYQAEIIDHINDVLITTDLDNNITAWNKGAEKHLGYTYNDAIGKNIDFILLQPDLAVSKKRLRNRLIEHGKYNYETWLKRKNGQDMAVLASLSVIRDANNEVAGIIHYFVDISQRKQAEAVLERARIIDQIHDAVIGTDLNGVITLWNRGAERQFGYEAKEIIGRPVYILYPEEKHSYSQKDVIKLLKTDHYFEYESSMKRKSGETFYVHSSLSNIVDEYGKIIGIISYTIDITERRLAEFELEKYRNQLEHLVRERTNELVATQNNLLNTNRTLKVLSQGNQVLIHANNEEQLLENICRIIVETGDYRMCFVGFAELDSERTIRPVAQWGYDEGYIDSLHLSWADNERGRGPSGRAIRNGKPYIARDIQNDPDFEPWRQSALQQGYESCLGIPLMDEDKAFGALLIYSKFPNAFDDEEVILLTELVNNMTFGIFALRARKELVQKQKLAVLGQLIATVSHELRNPLGTIRSSIYTIENKLDTKDDKLNKSIKRIERNIIRCDNIIEELLDYTRIRDLDSRPTNIDDWIANELNEYFFPESITVIKKFDAGISVNIEHDRFHRCLINVLNNACQVLQENKNDTEQKIIIETGVSNNLLEIKISDTGPGIKNDDLHRLFEPLYSTRIYGVGLGLPIVKQIMELHGGNIDITSPPGHGTTVTLSLPL